MFYSLRVPPANPSCGFLRHSFSGFFRWEKNDKNSNLWYIVQLQVFLIKVFAQTCSRSLINFAWIPDSGGLYQRNWVYTNLHIHSIKTADIWMRTSPQIARSSSVVIVDTRKPLRYPGMYWDKPTCLPQIPNCGNITFVNLYVKTTRYTESIRGSDHRRGFLQLDRSLLRTVKNDPQDVDAWGEP